jgi:hypothetical protein
MILHARGGTSARFGFSVCPQGCDVEVRPDALSVLLILPASIAKAQNGVSLYVVGPAESILPLVVTGLEIDLRAVFPSSARWGQVRGGPLDDTVALLILFRMAVCWSSWCNSIR